MEPERAASPQVALDLDVLRRDRQPARHADRPLRRIVRGMVALTLSVAGFLLTLWNFSRLTVVLFVVETGVWYLVISGVFYLSQKKD